MGEAGNHGDTMIFDLDVVNGPAHGARLWAVIGRGRLRAKPQGLVGKPPARPRQSVPASRGALTADKFLASAGNDCATPRRLIGPTVRLGCSWWRHGINRRWAASMTGDATRPKPGKVRRRKRFS